ncbi:MAG: CRTAC1 family protein [Isosphaeraceae bacterium]
MPGRIGYRPPLVSEPEPDRLYRNQGDGTFVDATVESGLARADGNGSRAWPSSTWTTTAVPRFSSPTTRRRTGSGNNRGGLKFDEVGLSWGVAYNETGDAMAGMGVAAGDVDGDGRIDLIVTNFYEEGHLHRNVGQVNSRWRRPGPGSGIPTRSKLGFGTGLTDLDNDGALDLFIANGHVNDVRPIRMPYQMNPQLFHNDGRGQFVDVSRQAGAYFQELLLGRSAAFGDLDNDGRVDIAVTHNTGPPAFLHNESPHPGHAVRLDLEAKLAGRTIRNPVGTRVTVSTRKGRIVRQVMAGTSYLSSSDPRPSIGIGTADQAMTVEVRWPDGAIESWTNVPTDRRVRLIQGRRTIESSG